MLFTRSTSKREKKCTYSVVIGHWWIPNKKKVDAFNKIWNNSYWWRMLHLIKKVTNWITKEKQLFLSSILECSTTVDQMCKIIGWNALLITVVWELLFVQAFQHQVHLLLCAIATITTSMNQVKLSLSMIFIGLYFGTISLCCPGEKSICRYWTILSQNHNLFL